VDPLYIPLVTVFGPIVGALIGALVTYGIVVKRKRLVIHVREPWWSSDPSSPESSRLHRNEELAEQRSEITVRNLGNATIEDVIFDAVHPGTTEAPTAWGHSRDKQLAYSAETEWIVSEDGNATLRCKVPFLNPGEFLRIGLGWQGTGDDLEIFCRMKEVKVVARTTRYWVESPWSMGVLQENVRALARKRRQRKLSPPSKPTDHKSR
jgi:hypothetical protein